MKTDRGTKLKIIIDIDNTLWDLAPELWKGLLGVHPAFPPPEQWNHWDFWEGYATLRDVFRVLRVIHLRQDQYDPYPEAKGFLQSLRERGFHIIVASHRAGDTLDPTERWLVKNGLVFDEIHLSDDKTVLFDGSFGIVDDSPTTLDKAARHGLLRTGLLFPWNANSGHPLFPSLMEILAFIDASVHANS